MSSFMMLCGDDVIGTWNPSVLSVAAHVLGGTTAQVKLTVSYWGGSETATLYCDHPTPDGSGSTRTTYLAPRGSGPPEASNGVVHTFEINIEVAGTYQAKCGFVGQSGEVSTNFTIEGAFSSARLEIESQQASTQIKPLLGCQPPIGGSLTVALNGDLSGICHELYSLPYDIDGVTRTITNNKNGTLTGTLTIADDESVGSVTFTLNTGSVVTGSAGGEFRVTETFVGGGSMISATVATGTASFTTRCVAVAIRPEVKCGSPPLDTGWEIQGTVPFRITFFK
jgi:hypothetical protein